MWAVPAQVQLHAQRLPLQEHPGAQLGLLGREKGESQPCRGRARLQLWPGALLPASAPLTMATLESGMAGRPGGTSEMLRKAETETEVPEGLMMQRGGADACSTSRRGASTAGL